MGRQVTAPERRIRVVVHGRVQGVGYRWHAVQSARELGLSGWVRNDLDGSVEAAAAGPAEAVAKFLEALQRGPGRGYVSGLEVDALGDEEASSLHFPFEISR
jgi:acylphosphatase